MLYDPKWEQQTKPDVRSMASLIAWLEKHPAAERYCFYETGGCLLHKYFTDHGFRNVDVGGYTFDHGKTKREELPDGFGDVAAELPFTFGGALKRARARLAND